MTVKKIIAIFSTITMLFVSKLVFAYDLMPPCPPASAFSHVQGEHWKLAASYHWYWTMSDFAPDTWPTKKLPTGGQASVYFQSQVGRCAYKTDYNYPVEVFYSTQVNFTKSDFDKIIRNNPNFFYTYKHPQYPTEYRIECNTSNARINIDCKF